MLIFFKLRKPVILPSRTIQKTINYKKKKKSKWLLKTAQQLKSNENKLKKIKMLQSRARLFEPPRRYTTKCQQPHAAAAAEAWSHVLSLYFLVLTVFKKQKQKKLLLCNNNNKKKEDLGEFLFFFFFNFSSKQDKHYIQSW